MPYSKSVSLGDAGAIVIGESGGNASIQLNAALSAGGGNVKGFAKATVAVGVEVEGQMLIDAGFGVIEAKFASNSVIQAAATELQALIDAELKNL